MSKKTLLGVMLTITLSIVLASELRFDMTRALGYGSSGTSVGGIVWENTTWTSENSPYIITDTVQIPDNVTLSIEPGVAVTSSLGSYDEMFLLHGIIYAHGKTDSEIVFDGGGNSNFFNVDGSNDETFLDLDHCIIKNGYSFWWGGPGCFGLRRSDLIDLEYYSYVWYPENDVYIEYNRFINAGGLSIGHHYNTKVYVRYNLFKGKNPNLPTYADFCVRNWASYGTSETIVKYNSFIDMEGTVLELPSGYDSAAMLAIENYWGMRDTDGIDSMIYDRNDDILSADFIDYLPILSEPHRDTPKISSIIHVDDDNTEGPWDGTIEHPYQNITRALNHAVENDTIFVYSGTYYENIILNKTLSLVGENEDSTIIDGERTGDVIWVNADNISVSGFTVQNSGPDNCGFRVDSSGSNVSHNLIVNNDIGIGLWVSSNNRFNGNTISSNDFGIRLLASSNNNVFAANNVSSNVFGIDLYCDNNTFVANNVSENYEGVYIHYSDRNNLTDNVVSRNLGNGLYLLQSTNNIISKNTITNPGATGIHLFDYSDDNTVVNNTLSNHHYGIRIDNSIDNRIFHNNFINNTIQVHSDGSINSWDDGYPSGGNCWSDYVETYPNATELDGSGIWDTPYIIDENNQDAYPVIPEFPSFLLLPLFMMATLLLAILYRRKHSM